MNTHFKESSVSLLLPINSGTFVFLPHLICEILIQYSNFIFILTSILLHLQSLKVQKGTIYGGFQTIKSAA